MEQKVIKEGTGDIPVKGDKVSIHYEIWFGEGTTTSNFDYDKNEYIDVMHDSTRDERDPFHGPKDFIIGKHTALDDTYTKGDSVPGIDEALLEMKVGEVRKIRIPSEKGYGELGGSSFHTFHGYRVPPNCPMDMEIELVEIKR